MPSEEESIVLSELSRIQAGVDGTRNALNQTGKKIPASATIDTFPSYIQAPKTGEELFNALQYIDSVYRNFGAHSSALDDPKFYKKVLSSKATFGLVIQFPSLWKNLKDRASFRNYLWDNRFVIDKDPRPGITYTSGQVYRTKYSWGKLNVESVISANGHQGRILIPLDFTTNSSTARWSQSYGWRPVDLGDTVGIISRYWAQTGWTATGAIYDIPRAYGQKFQWLDNFFKQEKYPSKEWFNTFPEALWFNIGTDTDQMSRMVGYVI